MKFDPKNRRSVARMTKAIDQAIVDLERVGGDEWEDVCDVMGRAMEIYDDPTFEPEEMVQ
jgi:hypothetical protein